MRVLGAIAAALVLLAFPAAAAAKPRLLETIDAPAGVEVKTRSVLQKEQVYLIEIGGFVESREDASAVDVLYCFRSPSCTPPSRQLGTVGLQMLFEGPGESEADRRYLLTDLARVRRIPYEPSHVYKERFRPRIDGRMMFAMTGGSVGKLEIKIYAGGEFDLKMETELKPRLETPKPGRVPPFANTKEEVDPDFFELLVHVKRPGFGKCTPERHRFRIGKRHLQSEELDRCEYLVQIPEGVHRLEVRAGRGDDALIGEQEVVVQDWLIVGLGDSVGSGEGNPDVPIRGDRDRAEWQSRRCHRSHYSNQARAAASLEAKDDDTSVTFLHLSCSGASIAEGLLGGYEGIEKGSATNLLDPQVSTFLKLVGKREVDAVVISIGANDMLFGPVLRHCVIHEGCMDSEFRDGATLRNWIPSRLGPTLRTGYADLAKALAGGDVDPDRVFVTGYPALLRTADGGFCDQVLRNKGVLVITATESEWLQTKFADPLNQSVFYNAVGVNRWGFVSDHVDRFTGHGYCAQASSRWVVTQGESESGQDNSAGSMHPNESGHDIMGRAVFKDLKEQLYPNGRPRLPRAKGEHLEDADEDFLNG